MLMRFIKMLRSMGETITLQGKEQRHNSAHKPAICKCFIHAALDEGLSFKGQYKICNQITFYRNVGNL